jgi:hypothetical protein
MSEQSLLLMAFMPESASQMSHEFGDYRSGDCGCPQTGIKMALRAMETRHPLVRCAQAKSSDFYAASGCLMEEPYSRAAAVGGNCFSKRTISVQVYPHSRLTAARTFQFRRCRQTTPYQSNLRRRIWMTKIARTGQRIARTSTKESVILFGLWTQTYLSDFRAVSNWTA